MEFGDSGVDGPEQPLDAAAAEAQTTLEDDMEANAAAVKGQLVERTASLKLVSQLEALLLWLQVSGMVFLLPAFWPHVVLPSLAWLLNLLAPLTFSLNFVFVALPDGWPQLLAKTLFVVILPVLLAFLSTRLWRDAHAWKLTFVDNWDATTARWELRADRSIIAVFVACTVAAMRRWATIDQAGTAAFAWLGCVLAVWGLLRLVAYVLKALYSNRLEGNDRLEFFFWLRSKLQSFSLLVSHKLCCAFSRLLPPLCFFLIIQFNLFPSHIAL